MKEFESEIKLLMEKCDEESLGKLMILGVFRAHGRDCWVITPQFKGSMSVLCAGIHWKNDLGPQMHTAIDINQRLKGLIVDMGLTRR